MLDGVLHALQSLDPAGNVAIVAANVFAQTAFIELLALLLARTAARGSAAARHGVWLGALACVVFSAVMTAASPQGRLSLVRLPSFHSADVPGESPALPAEPTTPTAAAV